ncbi:hypothetical protein [Kitasatospora cineracea]|uniref:hypothetical protein n=1 Tax=Kitasatospora cineracea TaxID=88074 RepID=UPI0033DCF664
MLIRSTISRLFDRFRKANPVADKNPGLSPYTVVLDWDGGDSDAPVLHVWATYPGGAIDAAREEAWAEWAGLIDEIPAGAEYDEGTAEDLWYSVAVLEGHAPNARY